MNFDLPNTSPPHPLPGPVDPARFWIESANHMIIGYHWLALLNSVSVSENSKSQKLKIL